MFNPYSVRDADSAVIPVLDPETKKPTGATITLAGPEHEKAKALRFANDRRQRKALEKSGRLTLDDPEVEADRVLDELVAVTLDWAAFCDDAGAAMPFSAEAVRKLYVGVPWLREQMLESRRDRGNFIKRSVPV
jgi:hypothetical protein